MVALQAGDGGRNTVCVSGHRGLTLQGKYFLLLEVFSSPRSPSAIQRYLSDLGAPGFPYFFCMSVVLDILK